MKELGRYETGNQAELLGILQRLETALSDIDRLQLMVVGAQLSQIIEELKLLVEV